MGSFPGSKRAPLASKLRCFLRSSIFTKTSQVAARSTCARKYVTKHYDPSDDGGDDSDDAGDDVCRPLIFL
jgi:hypothetical protein